MTVWAFVTRLLRFLDGVDDRPLHPAGLTVSHLERYLDRSTRPRAESTRTTDFNELRLLLRMPPMAAHLASDVLDHLGARAGKGTVSSIVGYSDGEFTRIVDAARRDVAALRSRITTGEGLLDHMPDVLTEPNQLVGPPLSAMADTGVVPLVGGSIVRHRQQRTAWAGQLFVTRADLAPLLTLLVAVTGRNVETLKELPAEHRIVGDRAVEVQLIKRRSGPNRWHDTVTWEIGPPHRDLHTPGGLYLLLHRLMARGRSLSNSSTIWSSWRNTNEQRGTVREHHDPFALTLTGAVDVGGWSHSQAIRTDTDSAGQDGELAINLRRLRTSVEVRRTRSLGGHLPSATRSNSVAVLFTHYLRGDPTAKEWAQQTLAEALDDAESAALSAHKHILAEHGTAELDVRSATDNGLSAGQEGAWTACTDPDRHPATGRGCRRVSFLDCFHCGNCVVTPTHLPAIIALTSTLAARRTELDEQTWWMRYGPTWTAIHREILPKFTAAQVDSAATDTPDCLLELAEDPWEH